jgi:hypothetical protein
MIPFDTLKGWVRQDLTELSKLGSRFADDAVRAVDSGKYDDVIGDFGGGSVTDLSDLIISLEETR